MSFFPLLALEEGIELTSGPLFFENLVNLPTVKAQKRHFSGEKCLYLIKMVEMTGFEPTTSWSRTKVGSF